MSKKVRIGAAYFLSRMNFSELARPLDLTRSSRADRLTSVRGTERVKLVVFLRWSGFGLGSE